MDERKYIEKRVKVQQMGLFEDGKPFDALIRELPEPTTMEEVEEQNRILDAIEAEIDKERAMIEDPIVDRESLEDAILNSEEAQQLLDSEEFGEAMKNAESEDELTEQEKAELYRQAIEEKYENIANGRYWDI